MQEFLCTICNHPRRQDIEDSALDIGARKTAKAYGVSRQALGRHMAPGHRESRGIPVPGEPDATGADLPIDAVMPEDEILAAEMGVEPEPPIEGPKRPQSRPRPVVGAVDIGKFLTNLERKRHIGRLLRTGAFNGMATLGRLQAAWPDLDLLGLSELVAQAAMESDYLRGTKQARRLVVLARADRLYRMALDQKDVRTALKCLEFTVRTDGVSAEPDLAVALAASQAWRIAAHSLQTRFPEALTVIHEALSAEESRKRQAIAPSTITVPDPSDSAT